MNLRAYATHPDPATAAACFVAVVLASNGPFYPLYVVALVGWARGHVAFLTMSATPFFLAVPLLARRAPAVGRGVLWLVGTINTVWCMKLLGPASGVGVFLLPCIALAVLLPAGWARLAGAAAPLLPLLTPNEWLGRPIMALTSGQNAHLAHLNSFSAACLMGLLALRLGRLVPASSARV
jgi:hypothetical protein